MGESVNVKYLYNIPSVKMAPAHAHQVITNPGTRIYAFHVGIQLRMLA